MNRLLTALLLWLLFLSSFTAFAFGFIWLADGNTVGYALAPAGLALFFWAALRLRRLNLSGGGRQAVSSNPPD
jgi:hypothetical protein